MIDHTGLKVSDPVASRRFYEAALGPLGTGGLVILGYGLPPKPDFWVAQGTPETPRIHIAFRAGSRAEVDAFHRAALAATGRDNGPGPRPHYHASYYGAFVLDPDGHNVEAVFHGAA